MRISVAANNTILKLDPPENEEMLTDFILRLTSEGSKVAEDVIGGTIVKNATKGIYTMLCVPSKQDERKTVELALHGAGFDHAHWTLGDGPGSKYNYVDAALNSGHATLVYDRLGTGKSDKPHGIKEGLGTRTEGKLPHECRIISLIESVTLSGVANKYGNLLDGNVLTGFTSHTKSLLASVATSKMITAALDNPERFGSLPSEFIIWNNVTNNQQNFFVYPQYDPGKIFSMNDAGPLDIDNFQEILKATEEMKWPATLGELLGLHTPPSDQYTNPVFVVTGDRDYIGCGGNFLQTVNGSNLVEATKELFPGVHDFDTYISPMTGHGLNAHLSAPETYARIQKWIADLD